MPWDPLRELQAWQERLATHHSEAWAPPFDVYETSDRYVITAEVPGLARDHIEISLEGVRVTVRGRRPDPPAAPEPIRFHQVERGRGPFSRTFEFAEEVDAAGVHADLSNGVLTITLPKLPNAPVRKIEVG